MIVQRIWGIVEEAGEDAVILTAPQNAADGIGSALALLDWSASPHVLVRMTSLDRWGGAECWRGPWFLLGCEPAHIHPCSYVRPDERGFVEIGEVDGPRPEDQRVLHTVKGQTVRDGEQWLWLRGFPGIRKDAGGLAMDGAEQHIGVFTLGRHSACLGLYCEGSRVRFQVTFVGQA